jgi:hypothetical protein
MLETKWSSSDDHKKETIKLERKISGRFAFNDEMKNGAFVYRCFSENCASWSHDVSRAFVDWLSETLSVEKPILDNNWSLQGDATP